MKLISKIIKKKNRTHGLGISHNLHPKPLYPKPIHSLLILAFTPVLAFAWGKRGHQIIGETAAILVSEEPQGKFLRDHSYDLGYYSNVPDLIWKRPSTYGEEWTNHFMNLEHFEAAFAGKKDIKDPFALSRKEFESKFPEIKVTSGRAYWRIRELAENLEKITQDLKKLKEPKGKKRQELQAKWLVTAGTLAHYIGDLSMPLHMTENYDGQHTGQKGIHSYFEQEMTEWLYPDVLVSVQAKAKAEWDEFKKKHKNDSILQLTRALAEGSRADIKSLLALDKGHKRKHSRKDAERYRSLVEKRLLIASLTLAEVYRRNIGWTYDGHRFFMFSGEPEFIKPGGD